MHKYITIICAVGFMAGLWTHQAQGQPLKTHFQTATLDTFETALLVVYPVFNNSHGFFRWIVNPESSQVGGQAPKLRMRYATGIAPGNLSTYGLGTNDSLIIPGDIDSTQAWIMVEDSMPGQYFGDVAGWTIYPKISEALFLQITRMDTASSGSTGTVTIVHGLITQ